jgi:drug/metabolite transporter (DMT)-like permease
MNIFAILSGLASGLLFGIATPISKVLLGTLNGFQLAGLLYLGAALAFAPFVCRRRHDEITNFKKAKKKILIIGVIVFGGLLGPVFLMLGLKAANSSSVSIWLNMELVATALLGVLMFKEHLEKRTIAGVVLVLVSGIVVTFQDPNGGVIPGLFITAACICWALDNHLTALIDGLSPQTITFIKGSIAGLGNMLIGSIIFKGQINAVDISLALMLGVFSYGISMVLYVISAQKLGATRSQILFSSGPFWGILLAFAMLGEAINLFMVSSMALLGVGMVLANMVAHAHPHCHLSIMHIHLHNHHDGHHNHLHESSREADKEHSHLHSHSEFTHKHIHYPDLHHRHSHS